MPRYDAKRIETKWQAFWDENKTFELTGTPDKEKLYVLDMFPYPSGNGLHVGHPEGYTATDITCRYARMQGKHVLHPMGWDAFGLPAEQHAIKTGKPPEETTKENIDTFRRQLKMLGFSYDWSREISTTDENYFRWTQWIFLELFDTWYDAHCEWTGPDGKKRLGRGRPIAELPIPKDVEQQGEEVVRRYQDKRRLAYLHEAPVNWCAKLGTVLANEEIIDGKSERGGHPVERVPLRQWMLAITKYSERLIDELEELDWSESIKLLQRNWIGKSTGAEVDFYIGDSIEGWKKERASKSFPEEPTDDVIRVYTTRPDTLYGATYMVLAPEHPFVERLTTNEQQAAVKEYQRLSGLKSDLDRTDLAKEKSGVFTGAYAINPVSGNAIPIWVADYVLISYGTGAIMAVPAHDSRDLEFAQMFDIEVIEVVDSGSDDIPNIGFTGEGTAINSENYNGLATTEFKQKIAADLDEQGFGKQAVNYKLRDWLFSRQHFWGEPFPIWHELDDNNNETGLMRAVAAEDLPVILPKLNNYKPTGTPDPPLSNAGEDWLYKIDTDGVKLKRETNSMPQWAGSCWYFLRYIDPKNDHCFIDPELEKYWMPVDLYVGGAEHAVLHLLYARFWHKVLFDRGHVSTPEPFHKLVNQGMILGEAELSGFQTEAGEWVSSKEVKNGKQKKTGEELKSIPLNADAVEKKGEVFVLKDDHSITVDSRAFKMSKSRGNVINPDDVVKQYGADSLRLYEMFMGPLEQVKPWSMNGVEGVYRFLGRVWRLIVNQKADEIELDDAVQDVEPNADQLRLLHKTIKAVTEDIEKLSFNTAISRMMEFTNEFGPMTSRPKSALSDFVLLLSPFAPHLAEELWRILGKTTTLAYEPWPPFDESLIVESEIEIPISVNGKLRAKIKVPAEIDQATLQQKAEADESVQSFLADKNVIKVIVVPGRMVNFVVKG
ncbi:Leucyl-tRNA synthetase [hydrothermal vent metagenome]|uniref:leucine--tRNA ligase n=1 Tax=hydrothermal vent metagenome TaxID=652676 RepID=A0A3B1D500_9ZZZZ